MKTFRTIFPVILCICFLSGLTSCVVVTKDNGKHKGWYKNTNNPHNPHSTNPGKFKGKK